MNMRNQNWHASLHNFISHKTLLGLSEIHGAINKSFFPLRPNRDVCKLKLYKICHSFPTLQYLDSSSVFCRSWCWWKKIKCKKTPKKRPQDAIEYVEAWVLYIPHYHLFILPGYHYSCGWLFLFILISAVGISDNLPLMPQENKVQ